ncbi:MAG: DUF177 domain-containing protein [Candidatus Omnitrophica bacterium]|nr:DUF177 domain-containing protein [Candidatus Omnitrophota bacterium]
MKIKISDVVSSGLEYQDQAMPKDLDIVEDFIDLDKPVAVQGRLTRVNDFILAKITVTYTGVIVCARCLVTVKLEKTAAYEFDLDFVPGDRFVDLGRYVREELLLTYESRTLCREDCRGICPDCGANLNEEACECKNKTGE